MSHMLFRETVAFNKTFIDLPEKKIHKYSLKPLDSSDTQSSLIYGQHNSTQSPNIQLNSTVRCARPQQFSCYNYQQDTWLKKPQSGCHDLRKDYHNGYPLTGMRPRIA